MCDSLSALLASVRIRRFASVLLAALAWAPVAQATQIASRSNLEALLVGGTLEDFESFNVADGTQVSLNCGPLNATAICNGQGPGLISLGLSILSPVNSMFWMGAGYYGAPSKQITANLKPLRIDFIWPVQAFGLDLRAYTGYAATATMNVYALDDTTLIGTVSSISLPNSGAPVFVGWEEGAGIGRVELTQDTWGWAPLTDNVEFGVTPEPATALLFGGGLIGLAAYGRRRRQ